MAKPQIYVTDDFFGCMPDSIQFFNLACAQISQEQLNRYRSEVDFIFALKDHGLDMAMARSLGIPCSAVVRKPIAREWHGQTILVGRCLDERTNLFIWYLLSICPN
ncbi:TPA: hypothetical protein DF272_04965 [Candidatus Falkowbacteria bacterium]|nr:hypothetical protein [Candidatus Falkowbacteria bacterium]